MSCLFLRVRVTGAIALAGVLAGSAVLGHRVATAQSQDATPQRIDRLDTAVQAEEGIRAVKRLQHTYGHYLETGLWSDLADLFTENAVGELRGGTITGKANLRTHFMQQAGRTSMGLANGQLHAHLILQPIVTLGADGTSAKGAWHEVAMLGRFGESASWLGGIYENDYVRENGVWKISRLRYYEQYSGSYDEYGHKAPAKWGVPYHFDAAHVGVTIPASALQPRAASTTGAPAVRLAQLAQRVQWMNDETQVQNLQHSYGYYLDRKLWDDVADLFADDGSLEVGQRGVYLGRPRIRRALETFYGASPLRTGELFDHINLATVVTVAADGRTASARTTELSQLGLNGDFARWEEGTYENEFVKQNGIWKFKAVRFYPRLATDYDKGWAHDAKPAATVSKELPPDRQPRQAFEAYPKTHYVAFHYPNPVTGRAVQYPSGPVTKVQVVTTRSGASSPRAEGVATLLPEVERMLDAVIAVDAVENLNSSYGYYIDESAWDQMADTFSKTKGAKEITGAGTYVGQDRIRKVLNLRGPQGGRTANFFTIHQLTQPVIHISEDGGSAKARLRLFQLGGNADGSSGSWIGGVYENTAFKEDGEWKFGVQDLHHIFNASYRNGWARVGAVGRGAAPANTAATPGGPRGTTAPAAGQRGTAPAGRGAAGRDVPGGGIAQGLGGAASPNRFATEFPPDRPIRARQYAFPQIVEPAFHYRNPVSGRMPAELLP